MKNKEANFQILKIAAMLMIVSHHLVAKNAFNIDTQVIGITGNKLALQILGNNAFIGNNLFFLVSAWFLSKKPDEKVDLNYSAGTPPLGGHPHGIWRKSIFIIALALLRDFFFSSIAGIGLFVERRMQPRLSPRMAPPYAVWVSPPQWRRPCRSCDLSCDDAVEQFSKVRTALHTLHSV